MNAEQSVQSEWLFIKKHQTNILAFAISALIFYLIYGAFIQRTAYILDDIWLGTNDLIYMANGRWFGTIVRCVLGHGPCYPISGWMALILVSAAIVVQTEILSLRTLWQKTAYSVLYLSTLTWIGNMQLTTMCDFFALSVLLCSLSVYFLKQSSKYSLLYAVLCLAVALGCYQTSAACFGAFALLVAIKYALEDRLSEMRQWILKVAMAASLAVVLYGMIQAVSWKLAPAWLRGCVRSYQRTLIGWYQVWQGAPEAKEILWQYIIKNPFFCLFPIANPEKAPLGQWLYMSVWIPVALLVRAYAKKKSVAGGLLLLLSCSAVAVLPFSFSVIMLSEEGTTSRVLLGQAASLAGIWGLCLAYSPSYWVRFRTGLMLFLAFVLVKQAYCANVYARDEAYFNRAAFQELRDMNTLAMTEAQKNDMRNPRFIACGFPSYSDARIDIMKNLYPDSVCPVMFLKDPRAKAHVNVFAMFSRLPFLRRATEEDEREHAEMLKTMPSWPAAGSVRADGDVVLIKIGDPAPETK